MKINKLFNDELTKQLNKQIREVNSYLYKKLEKQVVKQLLLKVLEKKLLPILFYPIREQGIMPMWYSQGETQVNIHVPVPELKLLTMDEAVEIFEQLTTDEEVKKLGAIETVNRVFEEMEKAVKKLE